MDPYLEAHWSDVHTRLATYISDQLNRRLPKPLAARVEERVGIVLENPPGGRERGYFPDVRVAEKAGGRKGKGGGTATLDVIETAEPMVLSRTQPERRTQRSIKVIDAADGDRLVTAIEILSPWNKVGRAGRADYVKKQRDLLRGGASLVEIDLIRAGRHVLAVPAARVPRGHRTAYRVFVVRAWAAEQAEYYPIPLRGPLPAIRVPLRESDPDAALDIRAVVAQAHELGRYEDTTDYNRPPEPPLTADDAAWAEELVKKTAGA